LRSGRVSKRAATFEDSAASTLDGPARSFATNPAARYKKPRVSFVHPLPPYAVIGARVTALGSLGGVQKPFHCEIIKVLRGQRVEVRFLSDSDGNSSRLCLPIIPTAYVGTDELLSGEPPAQAEVAAHVEEAAQGEAAVAHAEPAEPPVAVGILGRAWSLFRA